MHTNDGFDEYVVAELNRLLAYANAPIGDPQLAADDDAGRLPAQDDH